MSHKLSHKEAQNYTFTRVANFGGGFIPDLNGISGNPVPAPESLNFGLIVFIPPGATEEGPTAGSSEAPVGINRFQCCLHPWMRTIMEVADHAPKGQNTASSAAAHAHH